MRQAALALVVVLVAAGAIVALRPDGGSQLGLGPLSEEVTSPGPPRALSPRGQNTAGLELAGNARGDAVVVWSAPSGPRRWRLWLRDKPVGEPWGAPRALTGEGGPALSPTAAVAEDGTVLVGWLEQHGAATTVKVAARRIADLASGRPAEFTANVPGLLEWDLAAAHDGAAIVSWTGYRGDAAAVVAAERRPDGRWSRPHVVARGRRGLNAGLASIGPEGVRGVRTPRAAFDGAGNATLVWEDGTREFPDNAAPPVKQQIWTAVRPRGGAFAKPRLVSDPKRDARDPSLAVNGRGDAVVAWNSTRGRNLPGSRIGVATRRAGESFGRPRMLTPPGNAALPRAGLGESGDVGMVWTEDRRKGGYWCGCLALAGTRGSVDGGFARSRRLSGRQVGNWGIGTSPRGDVFAVWQVAGPRAGIVDDRVEGRLLRADGAIGALRNLSPRGDHDDPQALLWSDGTALSAWTRTRGPRDRIETVRVRVGR